jgi:uncharacterized protein YbjT (DUF2867 family)
MSCITVFGGTGFLGRRVVRHLRESGAALRIASRHPGWTEGNGVELIAADAHDERAVETAVAGADGVVNAVSQYVERGSATFRSVHVEAAARVASAARRAGVKRLAHLSGCLCARARQRGNKFCRRYLSAKNLGPSDRSRKCRL